MEYSGLFFAEAKESGGLPGLPNIIESLFPNIPNFIAHIVATIVIVIILTKLMYKPAKKMIIDRRKEVNRLLDEAVEKQIIASENETESKLVLAKAHEESSLIIQNAIVGANEEKELIQKSAQSEIMVLKMKAENDIEWQKREAKQTMKQEVIDISLEVAKKLIGAKVSESDNEQYINEFLKDLD
ncbi:F0F1 ATP synthase subunit B [Spiroplasma sp. TIUS-1]|uniref:F0F1 ATP synthase subunit B family protein n=1 Tax=Spiroplasma sp. TIUS-1 TaxID=216963 RepID=UPI0013978942|nr:ATP synthase F0 subunit B [Spiroplasma sp. TIUS-1]QHX35605.1 F0F1 ATP synthase subunit B [Spiroplasma sp. TIUS-1]